MGLTPLPHHSPGLSLEANPEASVGELCHGNAGLCEPLTRPLGKKETGFKGELRSNVGMDNLRGAFSHHEDHQIKTLRETHLLRIDSMNISGFPFYYILIIF